MAPVQPFQDDVNVADLLPVTVIDKFTPPRNTLIRTKSGGETWCVAWSQDGNYLAWSSGHRLVHLVPWNKYSNRPLSVDNKSPSGEILTHKPILIDAGDLVVSLEFISKTPLAKPHSAVHYHHRVSEDALLATGFSKGKIRLWEVSTGKIYLDLLDHRDAIRDLKFSPDGTMRLVSASRDMTLKVWDMLDDGNMSHTLKGHTAWIYACAWSPDGTLLCSVGANRQVILWDMVQYKKLYKLEGHLNDVVTCAFSPDGALLATGSFDTRVILWDPHTGQKVRELNHLYPVPSLIFAGGSNDAFLRGVTFSRDGKHLVSIADDTYVRVWNLDSTYAPELVTTLPNALCCSYAPNGAAFAVGTRDGGLHCYESPVEVPDLQHACRMAMRRVVKSDIIRNAMLPEKLKSYLLYEG